MAIFHSLLIMYLLVFKFMVTFTKAHTLSIAFFTSYLCKDKNVQTLNSQFFKELCPLQCNLLETKTNIHIITKPPKPHTHRTQKKI